MDNMALCRIKIRVLFWGKIIMEVCGIKMGIMDNMVKVKAR